MPQLKRFASKFGRQSLARSKCSLSPATRREVPADSPLTPRERRFVDDFESGGSLNQTKAYEAAYRARGAAQSVRCLGC